MSEDCKVGTELSLACSRGRALLRLSLGGRGHLHSTRSPRGCIHTAAAWVGPQGHGRLRPGGNLPAALLSHSSSTRPVSHLKVLEGASLNKGAFFSRRRLWQTFQKFPQQAAFQQVFLLIPNGERRVFRPLPRAGELLVQVRGFGLMKK